MRVKRMALSEVKDNLSQVVAEVASTGGVVIITRHGRDTAQITTLRPNKAVEPGVARLRRKASVYPKPTEENGRKGIEMPPASTQAATTWEDLNRLAERIRKDWPEGISAEDVMNDIRS